MNNEQILNSSIVLIVFLLHAGFMSLSLQANTNKQLISEYIEFVDLGDFGGGNNKVEASNSDAQLDSPPSHSSQPLVEDNPNLISEIKEDKIEESEAKEDESKKEEEIIKPVLIKKTEADISQTKSPLKPINKPKPKLKPKPKEKEQPKAQAFSADNNTANSDRNINKEGDNPSQGTSKNGRSNSQGEGGSKIGNGAGDGSNNAGSNRDNPIKASGSIPKPPYPQISQENGEEGTVVLSVLVAPNSRISDVKLIKSSGHSRLDRAAQNAAKDGLFNTTAWTEYQVAVRFQLTN